MTHISSNDLVSYAMIRVGLEDSVFWWVRDGLRDLKKLGDLGFAERAIALMSQPGSQHFQRFDEVYRHVKDQTRELLVALREKESNMTVDEYHRVANLEIRIGREIGFLRATNELFDYIFKIAVGVPVQSKIEYEDVLKSSDNAKKLLDFYRDQDARME